MNKTFTSLILILGIFLFISESNAQQVLDPQDWITVDNLNDGNPSSNPGTVLCDTTYCEIRPSGNQPGINDGWWSNLSATLYYGGSHRRTPNLSGSPAGASATYYFNIPVSDYYLVYHYMAFTGNASSNAYVTFKRFGEGTWADSFRYDIQSNNVTTGSLGSWKPLGIVNAPAASRGLEVMIGADTLTPAFVRVDAIRILRSRATGPDLEFGRRAFVDSAFATTRMIEDFPQTTFKYGTASEKTLPLWNIGSADLIVSNISFSTNRFSCVTPTPFTIPPGGKRDITIRFSPKGEEATVDTMVISSNDPAEPLAYQTVRGEGINYNFIMNASSGSEPHWNAPPPTSYVETGLSAWLNSAKSNFVYPIPGGNLYSRVYTATTDYPTATYGFQIADTMAGKYLMEYSGPSGSPNAATNATIEVVTPFLADTARITGFNERGVTGSVLWLQIADNKTRVFQLNGGGVTTVRFLNPGQASGNYLRTDLLRVRLLPIAPTASTSADINGRLLSWGSVSIYDSIRLAEANYQRTLQIRSNGETPLKVDSMEIFGADSVYFKIDNKPTLPVLIPAIDGTLNLAISFLPDSIRLYSARLRFWTNDTVNNRYINITLSGQGVGTNILVDDSDPMTFINTPVVDWIPGAPVDLEKWQRVSGSGTNGSRIFTYIYGYHYSARTPDSNHVEWFPRFPKRPGGPATEPDSFDVYVILPAGSSTGNPRAVYEVHHVNGITRLLKNQNATTYGGDVPSDGRMRLGRFTFLRGGQDFHGGGTIFGHVKLINNFNEVSDYYRDSVINRAVVDSHVTRVDAIYLEEASKVVGVFDPNMRPFTYMLDQNFPNPFNPTTQIRFAIPQDNHVTLKIYDVLGREVRTLVDADLRTGYHSFEWDGRNNYGSQVSSGIYIYQMRAGKFVKSLKMMMLK